MRAYFYVRAKWISWHKANDSFLWGLPFLRKEKVDSLLTFFFRKEESKLNVASDEVLEAFASDSETAFAACEKNDGGTCHAVIVGCHGIVISACDENGERITALGAGDLHVFLDQIAAFTASAADRAGKICFLHRLVCKEDGVCGLIECVARIIGHAAVDGNVILEALDLFDAADGVKGHARICNDASAGLHQDGGHGKREAPASGFHVLRDEEDVFGDLESYHEDHFEIGAEWDSTHLSFAEAQTVEEGEYIVVRIIDNRCICGAETPEPSVPFTFNYLLFYISSVDKD